MPVLALTVGPPAPPLVPPFWVEKPTCVKLPPVVVVELLEDEELAELDELLLDDEELELDELFDEDELLLELELDDEELEEPPHATGVTGLRAGYATRMESIFASPALLVASSRMLLIPAFRLVNMAVESAHVVQAPVAGKLTAVTSTPLTSRRAGRSPEILA